MNGRLTAGVMAFAACLAPACSDAGDAKVGAPSPLIGAWAFLPDQSRFSILGDASMALSGVIRVTDTGAGLELDLGCRCELLLTGEGRHAHLASAQQQPCTITISDESVTLSPDRWELVLGDDDVLHIDASALFAIDMTSAPNPVTVVAALERRADFTPHCGGQTAVGVIPYAVYDGSPNAGRCPLGAGMEGVELYLDTEDTMGCVLGTASDGEPNWVYPEAVKVPDPCRRPTQQNLLLVYCRVDGDLFTAAAGPGASYAVLKLGDRCPQGSREVIKHIDNEDSIQDVSRVSRGIGAIEPNVVVNSGLGTYTLMHFCLFRGTGSGESEGHAFPDLGLPYAVFHDFDGVQPGWVISKGWLLGDDESDHVNLDSYDPASGEDTDSLRTMIETATRSDGHTATVFDLARVR